MPCGIRCSGSRGSVWGIGTVVSLLIDSHQEHLLAQRLDRTLEVEPDQHLRNRKAGLNRQRQESGNYTQDLEPVRLNEVGETAIGENGYVRVIVEVLVVAETVVGTHHPEPSAGLQ